MIGLAAFLIAHCFYSAAFLRAASKVRPDALPVIPFFAFALALLFSLWSGIPESLAEPVVAYALVIMFMGSSAFSAWLERRERALAVGFAGALAFIASDSLIAIDKFSPGTDIAHPRVWVMSTYCAAQAAIVYGLIAARNQTGSDPPHQNDKTQAA